MLLFSGFSFPKHPYYMGVTELKYNSSSQRIEVSIKLFANDLEYALKKETQKQLDIFNGVAVKNNPVITSWCMKHFNLKVNSNPVSTLFIGYEIQDDLCWIYLETPPFTFKINRIELMQNMLYLHFKDQMHIASYNVGNANGIQKKINPNSNFIFEF